RLKKRFSLMLKGGLYRVPGGVSTQYGGLTKIKTVGHLQPSFPRGRESGPLVRQMRGRVARLSDKNRV
ncbi:hypothetical protein VAC55_001924, partial [Neisseria gonorrhoeae]